MNDKGKTSLIKTKIYMRRDIAFWNIQCFRFGGPMPLSILPNKKAMFVPSSFIFIIILLVNENSLMLSHKHFCFFDLAHLYPFRDEEKRRTCSVGNTLLLLIVWYYNHFSFSHCRWCVVDIRWFESSIVLRTLMLRNECER